MTRIFDLVAVIAVAVVLLLPKPGLVAHRALDADPIDVAKVAELEDAVLVAPESAAAAVELADQYLRLGHPDWTLASLARFGEPSGEVSGKLRGELSGASVTPRVHLVRATAHAERLEAEAAVAEVRAGLAACDRQACSANDRIRLEVIGAPMQALLDEGIDPYKDPKKAREAAARVLHSAKASDKVPAPTK
jgi:hypothetical protein